MNNAVEQFKNVLHENEKVIDEIQQINQRLHALQNNIEHTK